jgi:hypothetical protein
LTVSPSTYLTGARQNVCSVAGAVLVTTDFDSQACVFVGAAASTKQQNIAYHKEWATLNSKLTLH